jgi:hypothetical protein
MKNHGDIVNYNNVYLGIDIAREQRQTMLPILRTTGAPGWLRRGALRGIRGRQLAFPGNAIGERRMARIPAFSPHGENGSEIRSRKDE